MRIHRHIGVVLGCALSLFSTRASAESLAIGAIDAPVELRSLAQSVRFLMETERDKEAPGYLAARTSFTGDSSDYVFNGALELVGVYAVLSGTVTGGEGPPKKLTAQALRGEATKLTQEAAKAISEATGLQLVPLRGDFSLAQVQPFAAARFYYDAGEHEQAARVLLGASKSTARTVPAAKRIAAQVLGDKKVPAKIRLSLASALNMFEHVDEALAELSGKERKEWQEVMDGRKEIVRFQVKQSMERMNKLKRSKIPEVQLSKAEAAVKTRDSKALGDALAAMTSSDEVHAPSAAFIAELPSSSIPPELAPRLGEMSDKLRDEHPSLASSLALQSAAVGNVDALGSVDAYMLTPEQAQAASNLVSGGAVPKEATANLAVDLSVAAGNIESAQQAVAAGLELSPENQELLDRQMALAKTVDEPVAAAPRPTGGTPKSAPAGAPKSAPAPPPAAPVKEAPRPGEPAVAAELFEALTAFAALPRYQRIVIAPISEGGNSPVAMKWLDRRVFAGGLARAIVQTYGIEIVHDHSTGSGLAPARLNKLLSNNEARAVMLWDIKSAENNKVAVKLAFFRQHASDLDTYETEISGTATKLVSFNPWLVRVPIGLFAVFVLFTIWKKTRKLGQAWIRIKSEASDRGEYLTVRLSKSPKPPALVDLSSYVETLKSQGVRKRGLSASHVGRNVEFDEVPVGKYWVHLYGVYDEAGRLTPMKETREITVTKDDKAVVLFDLVPKEVEYRVKLENTEGPVEKAKVWLDDDKSVIKISDKDGWVTIWASVGEHTLHVLDASGELKKSISSPNTQSKQLQINIDAERRMADLGQGIEVAEEKEDDLAEFRAAAVAQPVDPKEAARRKKAAETAAAAKAAGMREEVSLGIEIDQSELAAAPAAPTAPGAPQPTGLAAAALPPTGLAAASVKPPPTGLAAASGIAATAVLKGGTAGQVGGNGKPAGDGTTGLSRYKAEKELGAGAMGVVMLAKDQVLDRTVALKVMGRAVQEHPAAAKMFKQEAKALAALNHPNIVTVFDQGNDNGKMYIVMEFVEGATLEDKLEHGPMTQIEALAITAQLGDALAYAHARNVIHRDIKPANIFLDSRNRVKLGDFGLARVMKEAMIRQTEIKGTPLYMSPEQIMGKDIDGRSDIYAVGCTLYEMLTGRPPFIEGEILFHQMHTDPEAPSKHNPDIPMDIDRLVLSCLAKEKEQRPADADTLVSALRGLLP